MKETDLRYEQPSTKLQHLATELKTTSDLLNLVMPLGNPEDSWHVVSPKFVNPQVNLYGYDISPTLQELAGTTSDLIVRQSYLDEEWDGDDHYPATNIWEIFPPQGSGFMTRYSSECHGGADLPGIGLTAYIPDIPKIPDEKQLRQWIEDGYLYIDLMSWRKPGEGFPYRFDKPESVMMNVIERNRIESLEVACWFLKGVLKAEDIHCEKITAQEYY